VPKPVFLLHKTKKKNNRRTTLTNQQWFSSKFNAVKT
jgi:hypothetical protein